MTITEIIQTEMIRTKDGTNIYCLKTIFCSEEGNKLEKLELLITTPNINACAKLNLQQYSPRVLNRFYQELVELYTSNNLTINAAKPILRKYNLG